MSSLDQNIFTPHHLDTRPHVTIFVSQSAAGQIELAAASDHGP